MRPAPLDLVLLAILVLGAINLGLHLSRSRAYWITFTLLAAGLPVLSYVWFSTPWRTDQGSNFGDGMPPEFGYAVIVLGLWAVFLIVELIVFIALKISSSRAAARESHKL